MKRKLENYWRGGCNILAAGALACMTAAVPAAAQNIQITAPGEAYGHHGDCAGWNGCGDAATCALWACQINGFANLVSYGASGPCTGFANCHLFNNQTSVQCDWGNWCDVDGVTDIVCSDNSLPDNGCYDATCGNGQIDGGEDCEPVLTPNGCCSPTCQFEASNFGCEDGDACTIGDQCDGSGTCNAGGPLDCDDGDVCTQDSCVPESGCVNDATPAGSCRGAEKSLLLLKDNDSNEKDKLTWKYIKGVSTSQAEFGVPTGSAAYTLCVYAGTTSSLVAQAVVPPDAQAWKPLGSKGYKYLDKTGGADGIEKIVLKGSDQDKTKALVKGKGTDLPDPVLPLALPVTAQLHNDVTDLCWEGSYAQPDVKKNDTAQFKAKSGQ